MGVRHAWEGELLRELLAMALKPELSIADIAQHYSVSQTAILEQLRKHDVMQQRMALVAEYQRERQKQKIADLLKRAGGRPGLAAKLGNYTERHIACCITRFFTREERLAMLPEIACAECQRLFRRTNHKQTICSDECRRHRQHRFELAARRAKGKSVRFCQARDRDELINALRLHGGNYSRTAKALGRTFPAVRQAVDRWGLMGVVIEARASAVPDIDYYVEVYAKHDNLEAAAAELGMAPDTLRNRIIEAGRKDALYVRKCRQCGQPFRAEHLGKRLCSAECDAERQAEQARQSKLRARRRAAGNGTRVSPNAAQLQRVLQKARHL